VGRRRDRDAFKWFQVSRLAGCRLKGAIRTREVEFTRSKRQPSSWLHLADASPVSPTPRLSVSPTLRFPDSPFPRLSVSPILRFPDSRTPRHPDSSFPGDAGLGHVAHVEVRVELLVGEQAHLFHHGAHGLPLFGRLLGYLRRLVVADGRVQRGGDGRV